jgi:hypothetical protein
MGIKVYLDDVRPIPKGEGWILVKTVPALIALIHLIGDQIDEISLDHDLGENERPGYDFVNWLEEKVYTGEYSAVPKLKVHSKNPVGKKKMENGIRQIWKKLEQNGN